MVIQVVYNMWEHRLWLYSKQLIATEVTSIILLHKLEQTYTAKTME